jgi:hypothetical protein
MENDDVLASPLPDPFAGRGAARQSDMQHITVSCPSGSRKFTLVAPPFLKVGDEIDGYGTVTKAKMTKGIVIAQKPHVERGTSDEATTSGEAKPSKRGTSGFGSTGR